MSPSVPIPTDNIYKFMCLFGLTIIVVSIACFTSVYNSTLGKKIMYYEKIKELEYIENRSKLEEDRYQMYGKLVDIENQNNKTANICIGIMISVGSMLSISGFSKWFSVTQKRDDKISDFQLEKIKLEVIKMRLEYKKLVDTGFQKNQLNKFYLLSKENQIRPKYSRIDRN